MKRLTLALAAIGLSATAFNASAAVQQAHLPHPVSGLSTGSATFLTVPQLQGGLVAGITGLYLQPNADNADLSYARIVSSGGTSQIAVVKPGFDFGYGANLGYIFPNTGNDINLSFWHLNTSNSSNANAPAGGKLIPSSFPITNTLLVVSQTNAKVGFRINQVDLIAGQYVNVGSRLQLHPFAGLRYAGIKRTSNSNYSGAVASNTSVFQVTTGVSASSTFSGLSASAIVSESSDFDGVGPIAGMNFNLPIARGFGAQGEFSGALLFGNVDSKLQSGVNTGAGQTILVIPTFPNTTINFVPGTAQFSFTSNTRRVIPNLDASLGAYYRFAFQNQSDVTLGINYQVAEYWNAVDQLKSTVSFNYLGSVVLGSINNFVPAFIAGSVTSQTANLFVQGISATLTYHAASTL